MWRVGRCTDSWSTARIMNGAGDQDSAFPVDDECPVIIGDSRGKHRRRGSRNEHRNEQCRCCSSSYHSSFYLFSYTNELQLYNYSNLKFRRRYCWLLNRFAKPRGGEGGREGKKNSRVKILCAGGDTTRHLSLSFFLSFSDVLFFSLCFSVPSSQSWLLHLLYWINRVSAG